MRNSRERSLRDANHEMGLCNLDVEVREEAVGAGAHLIDVAYRNDYKYLDGV